MKPEPNFTVIDLLNEIAPPPDKAGEFFTTSELSEKFSVSPSTILNYLKQLRREGWEIEVRRKNIVNFAGITTTAPAYRIKGKISADTEILPSS